MRAILMLAVAALPALGQSPSAWAPIGVPVNAEPVIASSSKKTAPASLPIESRLPPPDDGLRPRPVTPPTPPRLLPADLLSRRGRRPSSRSASWCRRPPSGWRWRSAPPRTVLQGQPVPCTVTVRNGACAGRGRQVRLPLPPGTRVVSADPPAQRGRRTSSGNWGICQPGPSGQCAPRWCRPAQGELSLRPIASYAPAVAAKTVIELPPVGVTIAAPEAVTVGDGVTLKIQIKNNTPSTLRNVGITCVLPDGLVHAQGPADRRRTARRPAVRARSGRRNWSSGRRQPAARRSRWTPGPTAG